MGENFRVYLFLINILLFVLLLGLFLGFLGAQIVAYFDKPKMEVIEPLKIEEFKGGPDFFRGLTYKF